MAKKRERFTLKSRVVLDPISRRFIQKNHIVRGKKVLDYPIEKCENEACGKDFPKKRKDQRFCSTLCRSAYHRKEYYKGKEPDLSPKQCVICGNTFTPTRPWSDKCNEECRAESRRRKLVEQRQPVLTGSQQA